LPNLPDHTFILHQPEANIMRVLTHKLDRDIMAIIGTSRTVACVDEFADRFPTSRYGTHRWKIELLKSQGAIDAADRLATIIEVGEEEAAESQLVAAS
jgi:hypothetical protein